ncbi:unnamed protein product [Kuraishia capsulata CBS 1993]|uniref:HTH CENPB-type domain-containing protein n=1 Tax=Kuraishia capsulata CBS 1993 TaxID=1382522 RepID=W6MQR3_9ASCO|nr:uncharacterized protein KUCA_T00000190001 [Kuraishia capsulata CBS 1993]CDK24230.1 unnamed protein product [Kuraishia capsulata CBS 1993]
MESRLDVPRLGRLPRANLEQKIMILNHFHSSKRPQSETVEFFRERFSISTSSFSEWLKNEQDLRERYNMARTVDGPTGEMMRQTKRKSRFKYDRINKAMYEFVQKKLAANEPLTEPVMREYWSQMAHKFGVEDPKRLDSFSHGWLSTFKRRHGLDRHIEGVRSPPGNSNGGAGNGSNTSIRNMVNGESVGRNRIGQLDGVDTVDPKVGLHDGFSTTGGPDTGADYGIPSIETAASGQADRFTPYEVSQLLNQDPTGSSAVIPPLGRRYTQRQTSQQPQQPQQTGQQPQSQQSQQQSQSQVQQPQTQSQQQSQALQNQVQQVQQPHPGYHINQLNSFLPLENQVNRSISQQTTTHPNLSHPSQLTSDFISVSDMERFVYMWGDRFFQQNSVSFPKSKEIFEQFKSKFFEERITWHQRATSGTSTVDEFFLRNRR